MSGISRASGALVLAASLVACGTSGGYWYKEGQTAEARNAAIKSCQAEAQVTNPRSEQPVIPNAGAAVVVGVGFAIFEGAPHDMAIYRCMERNGWRDMNKGQQIQPVTR